MKAANPLPEIAGLQACLKGYLALPDALCPRRADWERLLGELPEIPAGETDGDPVFNPAEWWKPEPRNQENPELYAVFSYHLCNRETEDLQTGINTFYKRAYTHDSGWAQDGMQAALLGLVSEARNSVTDRLTVPSAYARFPAFWGPSFDWIPDQDQGGSAAHAFQLMVMQCIGDNVHIAPTWPESWSLNFKMAGPYGTTITGEKQVGSKASYEIEGQAKDRLKVIVP